MQPSQAQNIATIFQSLGSVAGGVAQYQSANSQASQLRAMSNEVMSGAEQKAQVARYQAKIATSSARARAAASGASASDPSVINIEAGIQSRGEYNALEALHSGEMTANQLNLRAAQARQSGIVGLVGGISQGLQGYSDYITGKQTPEKTGTQKTTQPKTIGQTGSSLFEKYANGQTPFATPYQTMLETLVP